MKHSREENHLLFWTHKVDLTLQDHQYLFYYPSGMALHNSSIAPGYRIGIFGSATHVPNETGLSIIAKSLRLFHGKSFP